MQEQKGLDIVRRDWCPLCKDVGNFALREILSGKPCEEVVEAIHTHLSQVCTCNASALMVEAAVSRICLGAAELVSSWCMLILGHLTPEELTQGLLIYLHFWEAKLTVFMMLRQYSGMQCLPTVRSWLLRSSR